MISWVPFDPALVEQGGFSLRAAFVADEFKGHCLLEGARQADAARVKKHLCTEVVNFKHPYSGDAALVSGRAPIIGDDRLVSANDQMLDYDFVLSITVFDLISEHTLISGHPPFFFVFFFFFILIII